MLTSCQSANEINREKSGGVFQNRGVCLQAFPPLPTPTPLRRPFCSRPNFRAARMRKKLFARTGTLATQAKLRPAQITKISPFDSDAELN